MTIADTQSIFWLTLSPELLSLPAAAELAAARQAGTLGIAAISLYEIATMVTRGRAFVNAPLSVYLKFIQATFHVLPITAAIATRAAEFGPAYPKDPADRLIGATALIHRAPLVTKDGLIRASNEVPCIW